MRLSKKETGEQVRCGGSACSLMAYHAHIVMHKPSSTEQHVSETCDVPPFKAVTRRQQPALDTLALLICAPCNSRVL